MKHAILTTILVDILKVDACFFIEIIFFNIKKIVDVVNRKI